MGFLFKLLLIFLLIGFLLQQIGRYLFRRVIKNFNDALNERQNQYRQNTSQQKNYRPEKGINIDYIPEEEMERRQKSRNFKGGDYIDYEEL